jgi:hypothetical protein
VAAHCTRLNSVYSRGKQVAQAARAARENLFPQYGLLRSSRTLTKAKAG